MAYELEEKFYELDTPTIEKWRRFCWTIYGLTWM